MSKVVKVTKINAAVILANRKIAELKEKASKEEGYSEEEFNRNVNKMTAMRMGGLGAMFGGFNAYEGTDIVSVLRDSETTEVYLDLSKIFAVSAILPIDEHIGLMMETFAVYFSKDDKDAWLLDAKDYNKVIETFSGV